jgi:hypothetical protein
LCVEGFGFCFWRFAFFLLLEKHQEAVFQTNAHVHVNLPNSPPPLTKPAPGRLLPIRISTP